MMNEKNLKNGSVGFKDVIHFVDNANETGCSTLIEPIRIDYSHQSHACRDFQSYGPLVDYTVPAFNVKSVLNGIPYEFVDLQLLEFGLNDLGNCLRFLKYNLHTVSYNTTTKSWLIFNGKVWQDDVDGWVAKRAMEAMIIYNNTAKKIPLDYYNLKEITDHANSSFKRISSMLDIAKIHVSINNSSLDKYPHLITVKNGIVNMATGELMPFNRELLLTQYVDIDYTRYHSSYHFNNFLNRIFNGNADMIRYIQKVVGYSFPGETKLQYFFILYVIGNNCKSTFINVFQRLFSDFTKTIPSGILLDGSGGQGSTSPELAAAFNSRLLLTSETKEGGNFNESKIKSLSGEDEISARALYSKPLEYFPKFKIWFNTNYIPNIKGVDNGIWRRLRLIKFEAEITDEEKKNTGDIIETLMSESEAILAWVIQGAAMYYAEGLESPNMVYKDVVGYRQECDILQGFLDECTLPTRGIMERATALYEAYKIYCNKNLFDICSQKEFGDRMTQKGFSKKRDGNGMRYINIELKYYSN